MRMRLSTFLAALTALHLTFAGAAAAQEVTLIQDGQPQAVIYVVGPLAEDMPEGRWGQQRPSTPEQYRALAIQELNHHLQKMSGATLEVVTAEDAGEIPSPAIVLGDPAVELGAEPTQTSESQEGYRLLTRDGRILIGGQSDEAVLHGVYALLRHLGCDWVMPGEIGEVIPQRQTVSVTELDVASAPDFQSRRLWYRGYPNRQAEDFERFGMWLQRHQAGEWRPFEGSAGGHVWDSFIRRHQEEFEKDPTMYALRRDGEGNMVRTGPQLEATHPRVIELFVQDIEKAYEENIEAGQWTRDTAAAFGIGPADGLGYSLSAEAMLAGAGRVDPIVGETDRTDELILLGNRILERVQEKYPNALVGFYSYSTHADFPARYKPNPNIVQIFAPINFSRFHSILDPNSKTQAYYLDVVKQWGDLAREQGNPLLYRGYSWNLADNLLPYTKVRIWGEELPFYHEQGFLGLNVEGTKMWGAMGPSDYVFMRLAWDTSQDWRDLLRDYCEAAYGDGADAMERYHLALIERQHGAGMEAGSYHAFHLIYDRDFIEQAKADFDEALAAAQTQAQKTRIRYARLPLEALELYLDYHDATTGFDFTRAKKKYEAMHAHWQQAYDENPDVVANEGPAYLNRFLGRFVEQAVQYSTSPNRIVVELPDEVKTMFDPHDVGHRMRYQDPAINDEHFITTRTYGSTWDAQGLGGLRDTTVWYRYHFELPEDAQGKPIGLFIGSVEDEARVWINGQSIGTSGRAFSMPFVFDLTEGVDHEGENVLAIQVVRNSKANEIGLGGIIRPSFIFTGPRLNQAAPKPLELRRVLPGGELGKAE